MVQIFCNKPSLDFSSISEEAYAISLNMSSKDLEEQRRVPLPGSKFQMCSSVHFFIEENQAGSLYTFLNRLSLYGFVHKRYI